MVSKVRALRIADRIQQELSEMLLVELLDPRLKGVSVTDVVVDRELAYADIYVSALEGSSRGEEIIKGLDKAQGFIRSNLSKRIVLKSFPRLRFHWDETNERVDRIEALFAEMKTNPQQNDSFSPIKDDHEKKQ